MSDDFIIDGKEGEIDQPAEPDLTGWEEVIFMLEEILAEVED